MFGLRFFICFDRFEIKFRSSSFCCLVGRVLSFLMLSFGVVIVEVGLVVGCDVGFWVGVCCDEVLGEDGLFF